MKNITDSSLYFSVITEESLIQSYALDTSQPSPAQDLLYTSSSVYIIHQAENRVIDDILQAERAGDNLVITSRDSSQPGGSLNIAQFFSGNGELYLARPAADVVRIVAAQDYPQQGAIAFEAQSVDTVTELPQPQTVNMLSNALFSAESAPANVLAQPEEVAAPPVPVMAALTLSEPPKITHAIDQLGTRTGSLASGSVTDDKLAVLEGTASAGAILNILDSGVVIGQVQADAQGRWSFMPEERLAESGHVFTVVDTVSGETSDGFVLIVDSVAPSRAIIDSVINDQAGGVLVGTNQHTSDNTPVINGRGEAFSMIAIYNGKTLIGTSFADASGNWTFSSPFTFPDGDYTLTAKAMDFSGNTGLASSAYKITIDTIPPAVPVILSADDNVGPMQQSLASGDLTDDRTPTLHGKAEAGVTVFVYDGVQLLGTTTADATGNWSFTPAANLLDGEHQFNAVARDPAGNQSTVSDNFTLLFGEDRTPAPVISGVTDDVGAVQGILLSGTQTDDTTPTLHGQAQAGDTIRIYDNGTLIGETTTDAQGRWEFTPETELSEGLHSLQAQAVNGTHSPSLLTPAFELELDLTPPDASNLRITGIYDAVGDVTGNIADGGRTDDRAPTISGTGPAGEEVVVYVTEVSGQREVGRARVDSHGNWSLHVSGILNYGMNTFTAVAVDTAGNTTAPSSGYSVTVTSQDAVGGYDIGASQAAGQQINTTVVGNQSNPQVTKLANGNLLVVWQQDVATGYDVVMQLMDATGTQKIGTEQFVNQRNLNNQDSPSVTALADGGFVIAWESYNNLPDNNADGVMARRYDANGAAQTDEFLVNQTTAGAQRMAATLGLPDGGYIISWYSDQNGGSTVQRIYDANDNPVGDEFVVGQANRNAGGSEMVLFETGPSAGWYLTVWNNNDNSGNGVFGQMRTTDGKSAGPMMLLNRTQDQLQNYPDAISLKDGSFVVFWDSNDSQATGSDIRAIHYTFDPLNGMIGAKSTGDFIVNEFRAGKQYKPVGVALDDGGYMLIWGSDGGDGDGSAIYAQRFDANSNKVGHEFLVNPTIAGNQGSGADNVDLANILDATLLDNGDVFITWHSDKIDVNGFGIEGVTIDIDASFYSEFQVNRTTTYEQSNSSTTSLPGGGFVVIWQSYHAGNFDVMAQVFDATGMPVGDEYRVNNSVTANFQGKPDVITLSDGSFVVGYHSKESTGDFIRTQHYGYTYDQNGQISGVVTLGDEQVISQTGLKYSHNPEMTALDDGGYMLVWQATDGGVWRVCSAQYNAEGQQIAGSQMQVATTDYTGAEPPSSAGVTSLDNGVVIVTYGKNSAAGDAYFRIYDTKTNTYSGEIRANQTTNGVQGTPNVAKLANGNFVVTWDSNDNSGPDQSGWGVWGRIYNPQGEAVSNEFLMNSYTPGNQTQPVTICRPGGGFVALYISQADIAPGANTYGIYAQFFDDAGHRVGQEIRVHQLMYGDQVSPDATFLDDGRLFVTWTDNGVGDGSGSAVKGRIIDLDTSLNLDIKPTSSTVQAGIEDFSLTDSATHSDLWMLFDDGSSEGLLLSSDSLTAVRGGAGDDVIGISSTAFTSINGGDGVDTLLLDGKNMSLDLDMLVSRITGIEKIDLGQGNANSLSLSASALEGLGQQDLMVADGKNQLVVNGDGSNSLQLIDTQTNNWMETGAAEVGGVVYHTWVSGSTEVLVEQNIHVTVM
ncbi:Ig-like domain-containing protein [Enterobacter cloacae]|uniref:Ig-like domain-containing protein n=1 Tax=Enterobacter cloacae TaxID=550 RepID=UPI0006998001|nr:Ig-like domain-containing protein [Enterobacter cloacae]